MTPPASAERAARRAAPRHEPDEHLLPDGLRQLERRAARRARRRGDALHRLSLRRVRARCSGRRGGDHEARADARHRRAARRARPVRGGRAALPRMGAAERGRRELVATHGLVDDVRAVKDEEEVAKLQRSASIADRGLEALTAETWIGRSEREIAWRLRELLHAHGADELVVRLDRRLRRERRDAARPPDRPDRRARHARHGRLGRSRRRLLQRLHAHVLDRQPARPAARGYDVCLEAQQRAVANIKAGMTGVEADALAREPITDAGFGENFGHGLGHGVGLAVHEAPRLSTESTDTLEAGHCVSVEPGIYARRARRRADRGPRDRPRGRSRAPDVVPEGADRGRLAGR